MYRTLNERASTPTHALYSGSCPGRQTRKRKRTESSHQLPLRIAARARPLTTWAALPLEVTEHILCSRAVGLDHIHRVVAAAVCRNWRTILSFRRTAGQDSCRNKSARTARARRIRASRVRPWAAARAPRVSPSRLAGDTKNLLTYVIGVDCSSDVVTALLLLSLNNGKGKSASAARRHAVNVLLPAVMRVRNECLHFMQDWQPTAKRSQYFCLCTECTAAGCNAAASFQPSRFACKRPLRETARIGCLKCQTNVGRAVTNVLARYDASGHSLALFRRRRERSPYDVTASIGELSTWASIPIARFDRDDLLVHIAEANAQTRRGLSESLCFDIGRWGASRCLRVMLDSLAASIALAPSGNSGIDPRLVACLRGAVESDRIDLLAVIYGRHHKRHSLWRARWLVTLALDSGAVRVIEWLVEHGLVESWSARLVLHDCLDYVIRAIPTDKRGYLTQAWTLKVAHLMITQMDVPESGDIHASLFIERMAERRFTASINLYVLRHWPAAAAPLMRTIIRSVCAGALAQNAWSLATAAKQLERLVDVLHRTAAERGLGHQQSGIEDVGSDGDGATHGNVGADVNLWTDGIAPWLATTLDTECHHGLKLCAYVLHRALGAPLDTTIAHKLVHVRRCTSAKAWQRWCRPHAVARPVLVVPWLQTVGLLEHAN